MAPCKRRHKSPKVALETRRTRISNRSQPYQYTPLPTENSLRLLRLEPGSGHDLLSCHLDIVDSDQADPYEAISYAWGSPADSRLVLCGGGKVRVPTSLRDVLHNLRSPTHTLTLWADAICINQQDDAEKGHQVKIMGTIFANATRVLIWLGKEPLGGPPEYGLDAVVEWGEERDNTALDDIVTNTQSQLDRLVSDLETMTASNDISLLDDAEYADTWCAFRNLFWRPWFQRLWVIQEVGLAKSAIALFGHAAIEFRDLLSYNQRLGTWVVPCQEFVFPRGVTEKFGLFPSGSGFSVLGADVDFLDAMQGTMCQKATDSRDRVYALLSHPSATLSDGKLIVEPDYTKTKFQVYQDMALRHIEETKSLRILAAVMPAEDHLDNDDIPSWVPNWENYQKASVATTPYTSNLSVFSADQYVPPWNWKISADRRSIQVRGYIIDIVDEHTNTIDLTDTRYFKTEIRDFQGWPLDHVFAFRSRLDMVLADRISDLCCILRGSGSAKPNIQCLHDFSRFRHELLVGSPALDDIRGSHPIAPEGIEELLASSFKATDIYFDPYRIKTLCHNRKLFATERGRLGLGSHLVQVGDLCCVIHGCPLPLILRKTENGYRLLGSTDIQGFVIGESKPMDGSEQFIGHDFVLH